MSTTIGSAALTIIPSTQGFGSLLSQQVTGESAAAGKRAGDGMGSGILATAKKFVAPMAAAFAGASAFSFLKQSIQDAGALEQSIGAIETVFGSSSGQMLKWSQGAANAVGLTQNEFNELGVLIGSQLKNGGTSMDELGAKTYDLISVGADMAAMFGGTTKDAVSALSSALKGERDPIERYGVSLTQAAIDAKAAELGFSKVGGALSTEATQAATLALIMEQTADAHGRFGAEANTLAGQQQRLAAGWGNFKTSIGQAFAPALTWAISLLNQFMPSLESLGAALAEGGQKFADMLPPVDQLVPALSAVMSAANPMALVFKSLLPILPTLAELFMSVFNVLWEAVQPLLPILMELVSILGAAIRDAVVALVPIILELVQAFGPVLTAVIQALAPVLVQLFQAFTELLPSITALIKPILKIVEAFLPLLPVLADLIGALLPPLLDLFMAILEPVLELVAAVANALRPVLDALADVLSDTVVPALSVVIDWLGRVITAIMPVATAIIGTLCGAIGTLLSWLVNAASGIATFVGNAVAWFGRFVENVSSAIGTAIQFVREIPGKIGDVFSSAGSWLVDKGRAIMDGLRNGISNAVSAVTNAARNVLNSIKNAFSGAGSWLRGVGQEIINGLINGISSMASRVASTVRNVASNAVKSVKNALGIHSPSRVFAEIGGFMGEGMAIGLEKSAGLVQDAADGLTPTVAFRSPDVKAGGLIGQMSAAAQAAGRMPSVLEVRDADGDLIGRMQVEAGRVQSGAVSPLSHGKANW